jgi:integrase
VDKLVDYDILDKSYTASKRNVLLHAENWRESLGLKATSSQYIYESHRHVEVLAKECKWAFPSDISAEDLRAWLKERKMAGVSVSTLNHYIRSIKSFCYWLVKERFLTESPIRHIPIQDEKVDIRYKRRSLSASELIRLFAATEAGKSSHGMTGRERYLFYKFQGTTGIRKGETRRLQRNDFNFTTTPATVTIRPEIAKDRREAVLPLRKDVAEELSEFMADFQPTDLVFKNLRKTRTAEMLRRDLEAAGISPKDELGRVVDCHSLRYTFATLLCIAGVPLVHAQRLMRHKDPKLTANIYTDINMDEHVKAVEKLPDLAPLPTQKESSDTAEKEA